MNESTLWDLLKKGMTGRWDACRIESAVTTGFPDVDFGMINGTQGKIELKNLASFPKRPETTVKIPHFTKEQKLWIRNRGRTSGNVWLLVRVLDELFLFTWSRAVERIGVIRQDQWYEEAKLVLKKPYEWRLLHRALMDGC